MAAAKTTRRRRTAIKPKRNESGHGACNLAENKRKQACRRRCLSRAAENKWRICRNLPLKYEIGVEEEKIGYRLWRNIRKRRKYLSPGICENRRQKQNRRKNAGCQRRKKRHTANPAKKPASAGKLATAMTKNVKKTLTLAGGEGRKC